MKTARIRNKIVASCCLSFLFISVILPTQVVSNPTEILLPAPLPITTSLEQTMLYRMSVRNFTSEQVTDQELSTILWAAYGYTSEENRTIPIFNNTYAAHIYVLTNQTVYKYNPEHHSLLVHCSGDFRNISQYPAPIQLGIVWNTTLNADENLTSAQIGAIGQNIQFMANALNLGTVVTIGNSSLLRAIGLPEQEVERVIMPLGHPEQLYNFVYRPLILSSLPRIRCSGVSLQTALNNTKQHSVFSGDLSSQNISQFLWAAYGYSYYLDKSNQENNPVKRHRTVPSAHGYYPLRIYLVTSAGIFVYNPGLYDPLHSIIKKLWHIPVITELRRIKTGDYRAEIADAVGKPDWSNAPAFIISVLNKRNADRWDDYSTDPFLWIWSYEAGCCGQNILLEASAWNLSAAIYPVIDNPTIHDTLRLTNNFRPLYLFPLGKP